MSTCTQCSSGGVVSWRVTTLSVLAGVGAGYLIGLLTTKWLLRESRGSGGSLAARGRSSGPPPPASATSDLVASLTSLTAELANLQAAIGHILSRSTSTRQRRRYPTREESTASEYVSAPTSDDEFYDLS